MIGSNDPVKWKSAVYRSPVDLSIDPVLTSIYLLCGLFAAALKIQSQSVFILPFDPKKSRIFPMVLIFRRDLFPVAMAGAIVVMGIGFIIPLFPLYVSKMGANNFELGLIISGFTISQFLVQPFFGGLSDRLGRKPFMIGGLACYGLVAASYILAKSLPQIFLVRLLHGFGAGMIWPAMAAYVIDQSPIERRGESMGLLSAVEMLGFAIGPFL
ncbi:MAG: MFS transporter, partial [Deltaproteobacteria bacterium]|nr:MFS transporter [Deltaproteobacteria bacterium]